MKKAKLILGSWVVLASVITNQASVSALTNAATSTGEIKLIKKTGATSPTHPIKPGEVDPDPTNPPTGNQGDLTIDYISNITFGRQQIANRDTVYFAELGSVIKAGVREAVPNYVQVTDDTGTLSGWSLKVKQAAPFSTGTKELKNTTLTFKNGVAKSDNTSDPLYMPKINPVVLTPAGDAALIAEAQAQQGMGTWVARFGKDNTEGVSSIELMIPWDTAQAEGAYHTSLDWELGNTPE